MNNSDMRLDMIKDEDNKLSFCLRFNIFNKNIDIKNIINFKIFELIGALNKDIIEQIEFDYIESNKIKSLMIFKEIGKELGLKQKYIYSETELNWENENVAVFDIKQINNDNLNLSNNYEPVDNSNGKLLIEIVNTHYANIVYNFQLSLDNSMPLYMKKMPGNIMKELFLRLKTFIENMI